MPVADSATTLTAAVVVAKVLESVGTEAGRSAWAAVHGLVRRRLEGSAMGQAALDRVKAQPTDETSIRMLAKALDEYVARDPSFRNELVPLVRQAEQDPLFATNVYGDVQRIVNIGEVHGTVNI